MYTEYKVQRITKNLQYHVILLLFFSLKDTKICVRGSLGLKIGQDCENLSSTLICFSVLEAKPFQSTTLSHLMLLFFHLRIPKYVSEAH